MHGKEQERQPGRDPVLPKVGIFYVTDGQLHLDVTPLYEGEDYGDFKTHANSHMHYWTVLARTLKKPTHFSYDYYPRGRVNYSNIEQRFYLYLDRCLIKSAETVQAIIEAMDLSDQSVEVCTDEHYQCAVCNANYVPDIISL